MYDAMVAGMAATACRVDCTFPVADGEAGLRAAIDRVRRAAEQGVREGCAHVVLSDEAQDELRAPIPMILATAAVHTWLVRQSLRTFTSLNVRASECLDVHTFAVLVGVGATTINAYLAQECIADRHRRGLFGAVTLKEAVGRYKKAIDKGLLKVMSKLGISVISSYRGGYNFEADRPVARPGRRVLPRHAFSRISGIGLAGHGSARRSRSAPRGPGTSAAISSARRRLLQGCACSGEAHAFRRRA